MSQPRVCCTHPGEALVPTQVIIIGEAQERGFLFKIPIEVFPYARGINSKKGRGIPKPRSSQKPGMLSQIRPFWPQKNPLFHFPFLLGLHASECLRLLDVKLLEVGFCDGWPKKKKKKELIHKKKKKELIHVTIGPFDRTGSWPQGRTSLPSVSWQS